MRLSVLKQIAKTLFIATGAIILFNGVALFFTSNVNVGNFITVLLGLIIMLLGIFYKKIVKPVKLLILIGLCLVVALSCSLIIYGKGDSVTYNEDAVIVLGAAVHGKTPGLTLKKRLDAAVKYHSENPNALIIVSGGKGFQEDIPEAEAMQSYLIENGVDRNKIIKEESATDTYENFLFSKALADRNFNGDYTVAYITNEYHIFRSRLCAEKAGIKGATHLHSNTPVSYLISGTLRECLAVIKYIIFK